MELFSEIYSSYYKAVEKILNQAMNEKLTKQQITELINENAFSDSALYILPRLAGGEWNLMQASDTQGYSSRLHGSIERPMTNLEQAWLKALLKDRKMKLFLEDDQIDDLNKQLTGIEPLYDVELFHCYDVYADGDRYEDQQYIQVFRTILRAVKSCELVSISFESGKGRRITGIYLPFKIEFSGKDDKFRVYAARVHGTKIVMTATINLARISAVEVLADFHSLAAVLRKRIDDKHNGIQFKDINKDKQAKTVVIEISNERNALERCMLHFASYEKSTEYNEESDRYISTIFYDGQDETELLIRILSFGPVIKVLGPDGFVEQIRDRIRKQNTLLGLA